MSTKAVIAVDLGASSGRVLKVTLSDGTLSLQEINRFPHGPKPIDDRLCWDLDYLWGGIRQGIGKALASDPTIASIGVDSWAVDFVPVDGGRSGLVALCQLSRCPHRRHHARFLSQKRDQRP